MFDKISKHCKYCCHKSKRETVLVVNRAAKKPSNINDA